MALPTNFLQQVQTYQTSHLAYLLNYSCFIHSANKRFNNFQDFSGNLGDTVTFTLPTRFVSQPSLVANLQPTVQRVQPLVVGNASSVPYGFSAEQYIFNVQQYMEDFGKGAVAELRPQQLF